MVLLEPLLPSITTIQTELLQAPGLRYLIGGSCGLLLQQVDIGRSPRDLDIYVDVDDVTPIYSTLHKYAVDSPVYSETPIYASILSHYQIDGTAVEVVGDFKVQAMECSYQVEVAYLWETHSQSALIDNQNIRIMPLAHELLFNLLRDRPDRYEAIVRTMMLNPEPHRRVLADIMQRNQWGSAFRQKVEALLPKR
ncbi:hypothetical protein LOZ80_17370 [Paenibacillus sp. HWE-109]|uniref:hypothetical protein n=1 Tax=Paenibacillus sp. HWE-109 TaxID=1306526 RepID=UPI001EDF471F|nr:hypothetical protein [Paenibacillus sp. HWE-109]UKS30611.1 hypothetical protein LOZ80_17370 [Paenibacillus sp. HWE-109]